MEEDRSRGGVRQFITHPSTAAAAAVDNAQRIGKVNRKVKMSARGESKLSECSFSRQSF